MMKKYVLSCLLGVALLLSACGPAQGADSSGTSSVSDQTGGEAPAALTQADVAALFPPRPDSFPNMLVDEIVPYEGDFLVIRRAEHDENQAIIDWVFSSGKNMTFWTGYDPIYTILSPGVVQVESDGKSPLTPWQGMPERTTCVALERQESFLQTQEDLWLAVEQPWMVGFSLPETGEDGRYEQLYDARVGLTDLQFTFIPSGDADRFQSFFPAATSIPTSETSFDPDSRLFTLRLHNICLSSGGITDESMAEFFGSVTEPYSGLYPYTFPAGALGGDSTWFSGAQITQEGEDTLVTVTLAQGVNSYRMEWGNLGYDTIPWLRVAFSVESSNWNLA